MSATTLAAVSPQKPRFGVGLLAKAERTIMGLQLVVALLAAGLLPIVMVVAHVLEERSLLGSRDAIRALERLTQTTAPRLAADGSEEVVGAASLRVGDRVLLRAGDRAPCDGLVLSGQASMDTSSLTGESVPVDVAPGATVLGGSSDINGALEVLATSIGTETTLGKIVGLLREAERGEAAGHAPVGEVCRRVSPWC